MVLEDVARIGPLLVVAGLVVGREDSAFPEVPWPAWPCGVWSPAVSGWRRCASSGVPARRSWSLVSGGVGRSMGVGAW